MRIVDILLDILQDPDLDVTPKSEDKKPDVGSGRVKSAKLSNHALKLRIVRRLWSSTRTIFPHGSLSSAGERLVTYIMKNEDEFTDSGESSRTEWAAMCTEILVICDLDLLKAFWGHKIERNWHNWVWGWPGPIRGAVWKCFAEKWAEDGEGVWEGVVILLAIPFT